MQNQQQPILPDAGGFMLVAGSWCPLLAVTFDAATMGLLMSILVSCLAVVDYGMKIYGKARQIKDEANGKSAAGGTLEQVEGVLRQIREDIEEQEKNPPADSPPAP